ncbi:multi-component transcriptional regulator [Fischerella sp. NIES-4106]|jgi:DNA-binding response OmpR family regulator|nr:multi-component transcriptional regulator [Fischerella sp. NIES-4106]
MKILIVEDDELVAHVLAAVLTSYNYAVEAASNGQTAWDLIQTYDYDLILLDVILPEIDGITLCRQIRARGLQMPILLLTGCDSSHEKAIGLDAGADDYLVKPFDEEELVARIRALLRRGSVVSPPVLEWDNLRLDPTSCEVMYAEELLSLTPKEYALLELFLRNSRRVFSCGMILEHLWSYEDIPGEEAVRTHIKGLRQKLKAVGAPGDLIETVYGIGYRLKPGREEKSRWGQGGQGNTGNTDEIFSASPRHPSGSSLRDAARTQSLQRRVDAKRPPQRAAHHVTAFSASSFHSEDEHPLLLVVDCDRTFTAQIQQAATHKNLQVAIATDTTIARNILYQNHPSIVLLDPDISSNHQDSFNLLAELHERKPPVPVIILTKNSDFSNRLQAARNGGHTFLPKPMSANQVLEAVNQVLQESPHAEAHILAVDNDPKIGTLLQKLLIPWGIKVTFLENPLQFWETLEAVTPDLLILDVEILGINGIEICQVVRNDPQWSELPILFLTVHNDADIVNQVFAVGADDFVSKPIVGPELITRIVNRLERVSLRRMREIYQTGNTQAQMKRGTNNYYFC